MRTLLAGFFLVSVSTLSFAGCSVESSDDDDAGEGGEAGEGSSGKGGSGARGGTGGTTSTGGTSSAGKGGSSASGGSTSTGGSSSAGKGGSSGDGSGGSAGWSGSGAGGGGAGEPAGGQGGAAEAGSGGEGGSDWSGGSAGAGGEAGGSDTDPVCDPTSGTLDNTPYPDCAATNEEDPCEVCIEANCCEQSKECWGYAPGNVCGWGGPGGEGEISCYRDCLADAAAGEAGECDQDVLDRCADDCTTQGCNAIGDATWALAFCALENCPTQCFGAACASQDW